MKITNEEFSAWAESATLEVRLGARSGNPKTWVIPVKDLPMVSLAKAASYGFTQWIVDRVAGDDIEEAKKETEIFLAKVLDGSWVHEARKNAAPPIDEFTNVARKMVLATLGKADRKRMAELPDKGVKELDAEIAKLGEPFAVMVRARMDKIAQEEAAEAALRAKIAAMRQAVEV